jgi:hypothetical protein
MQSLALLQVMIANYSVNIVLFYQNEQTEEWTTSKTSEEIKEQSDDRNWRRPRA